MSMFLIKGIKSNISQWFNWFHKDKSIHYNNEHFEKKTDVVWRNYNYLKKSHVMQNLIIFYNKARLVQVVKNTLKKRMIKMRTREFKV